MGVLFSVPWKKKTPGRPAKRRFGERIRCPKLEPCISFLRSAPLWPRQPYEQQVQKLVKMGFSADDARSALTSVEGDEILAIKMLRFAECAWAGNDTNTKLWQPDEQQVQKLVEMGFAEAAVGSALEAVNGDEILAIKMLFFAECGPAGIDTFRKLWQPDEQQVQKLVEMGFAEAAVRNALEAVNGDEILAIKMLHFADYKIPTFCFADYKIPERVIKLFWPDQQQRVQKLVEMGFAEAAVRSALKAFGNEIMAIEMLRFAEGAWVGSDTNRKPDEQQVQVLVERGFTEAAVGSALEAADGDESLAFRMLSFAECGPARIDTNRKLWQPDEQWVQKLVGLGFAEAAVRRALEAVNGDEILAIKILRFAECAWAGNDTNTKLWQPDEQRVQKLVEMGFAEADVRSALEAVNGGEILAIKMLCFAECARAGNDTNAKLWQPDEQQVQKCMEMGFAEAVVRRALEAVNGDEILAIKMLCFAEFGPAGIYTYGKLWQPDEQRVQKLVEMGFTETAVRSALEATSGDEILAVKMLRFAECAQAGNGTTAKLWLPDEQRVQKLVEMGFVEDAVRSALEAVNGDETLALKMLRFAECARAGNDTNTKLWQPDEQQVQKLVEMGFAEVAIRSALEAVNGDEILALKMLRFAEFGTTRINTYRKLWQPDEQRVQKLVEMGFAELDVRRALEAVNGDEILAIKMLRFAECARAGNYTNTKPDDQLVQKLVEMGFAEAVVRSALETVNGVEILAIKMLRFAEFGRAGNYTNTKLWQPDEQQVQKLMGMGFAEAAVRSSLEAVNGAEILAIKMLSFAECARAGNDTNTKGMEPRQPDEQEQKLVKMGFAEADVRSALQDSKGDEILAIKMLRLAERAWVGNVTNTKLWQPDEQQVQKLVEMGFAEAAVGSALEAVNGDESLAIKMLFFAECGPAGIDTYRKLWQPDEQRVQKLVEMGFVEDAVRSALEAVNGDEILAVKLLRFAECARVGNDTNTKPDEQQVQKLVEMGCAEAAIRSALVAVNGDEILAIKLLRFAGFGPARINTYRKLWRPDEQRAQKLVEMGFGEAAVRIALEAVNGDEILAIKMLRFAQCARAGNYTNTKPDEQRVQKLMEMGFAEAAVRSALEAVNGVEILAIKMLRFAECARAENDTNTKLWQPDGQQVQKLVEMCCDDAAGRSAVEALVRSALEAVNGDEILAITMLRFVASTQARNDKKTKEVQNLIAEAAKEVLLMLFIICLFFVSLLNSEAINGDEILDFKLMK